MDRTLYSPSVWGKRFHDSVARETLGGGAAGMGKSWAMLFDPLVTQATVEHCRMTGQFSNEFPQWLVDLCKQHPIRRGESEGHAIHFRRTMPQLRDTMDRAHRMFQKFDPGAVWQSEPHRWVFSSGFKYTFGHCKDEKDTENYLSNQYSWMGFDEACQFTEKQYQELTARVRSSDPILHMLERIRAMSNPAPGWLKDRFVSPCVAGHKILKLKVHDPVSGETEIRTLLYLPARLDDNPDKAFVRRYKFELLAKPAHMRARYLYGDWDSVEGGYFEDDWNPGVHVIEPFKIPRDWPKFRSMDWGYKAPGTIGWFALDKDDNLYQFYEFNFRLMKDEDVAKRVVEIEKEFGFWDQRQRRSRLIGVADTQLWEERGDSGKPKASVFAEHGVYWQPAEKGAGSIMRHAERISARLRDYDKNSPPGLMVFNNCRKTQEMFASINVDENDSTVPDKKSPLKHWFDMVAYACARASRGRGSIPMTEHEFDLADRDDEEETAAAGGSFGY